MDPLACVFFDAICLQERGNHTAVTLYMETITRGFNFDNMIGAFVSGIGLFSVARFGGIPVPNSPAGRTLWWSIVFIQVMEYILIFMSLVMLALGYFHVRFYHRDCMYEVDQLFFLQGVPIMDICLLCTFFAIPAVGQGLRERCVS